jgi:hypothetical protein
MHKLRNPIAVFIVAVLVVITIGVGAVGAVQSPKVYGPSWGRFSVAFARHDFQCPVRGIHGRTFNLPFECTTSMEAVSVFAIPLANPAKVARQRANIWRGATVSQRDADGLAVVTVGPECSHGQCRGAEVISNGRVLWYLLALSGSASGVEDFLASFQPIG